MPQPSSAPSAAPIKINSTRMCAREALVRRPLEGIIAWNLVERAQRDCRTGLTEFKPSAECVYDSGNVGSRPAAKPVAVLHSESSALSNATDLKTIGLKATLPRLRILELFEKSSVRHLSAEDVYRALSRDGLEIGLATIYRVLTQFEQAGLVPRHRFESEKAVYELNDSNHHDHLVCLTCGRVEEFVDEEIESRQARIASERGFGIRAHSLYLYAECQTPDCAWRMAEDAEPRPDLIRQVFTPDGVTAVQAVLPAKA